MKCDRCKKELSKDDQLIVITIGSSKGERIQCYFCDSCAMPIVKYITKQVKK